MLTLTQIISCLSSVLDVFHAVVFSLGLVPHCMLWKLDYRLSDILYIKYYFKSVLKMVALEIVERD